MASAFFGSIGNGITNTFNTAVNGIGSGINYFNNSGVGHFFGSVLNSGSTFLSGIASIPSSLTGLVNGISNNSTLFLYAVLGIGLVIIINDFKGSSNSIGSYSRSYRYS